jgi:glycine betaine/proline transport system substrate-binding protein
VKKAVLWLLLAVVSAVAPVASAAAAEPVGLVDASWDSIQVHNRIAGFILEHGFGYAPEYVFAESMPGLMAIERGDAHLSMEGWVDNVVEWWEKAQARKTVADLGSTFPDAPQGWYVPTYMIKGDAARGIAPVAPDLKSVADLPKYWELFKDP